ncbi:hypothetical protein NE553_16190, partial [Eggerthella lenta]|nr:hypothetical protein [Eggerthella lenta]
LLAAVALFAGLVALQFAASRARNAIAASSMTKAAGPKSMSSSFKVANLAIFGYEHFGGVEVDALVHCEPLDQGDVRIGLAILPYPDLLDEPVEPQS